MFANYHDSEYLKCVFYEGEFSFKNGDGLVFRDSLIYGRFPFWNARNVTLESSVMGEDTRAALWYAEKIDCRRSFFQGSKLVRESSGLSFKDCRIDSDEALWRSRIAHFENSEIAGSYFGYNAEFIRLTACVVNGKFAFQYVSNIELIASSIDARDTLWHAKNGKFQNSVFSGENIGWHSENLTFVNCTFAGIRPFCYAKNLTLINCTFLDGSDAFEESVVKGSIRGELQSIYNPREAVLRIGGQLPEVRIDDPKKHKAELLLDSVNH